MHKSMSLEYEPSSELSSADGNFFVSGRALEFLSHREFFKVVLQKSIPAQIRQRILILVIIKDKLTDLCGN